MNANRKFAVLFDGDNISPELYDLAITNVKNFGVVLETQVYARKEHLNGWVKKSLDRGGIKVIPVIELVKNASDIHIGLEAMNLALQYKEINAFCVVSSDTGYCVLFKRLIAHGKYVLGMGEAQTTEQLQKSCNYFVRLEKCGTEGTLPSNETVEKWRKLTDALEEAFMHTEHKGIENGFLVAAICETIRRRSLYSWEEDKPLAVLKQYAKETGKIELFQNQKGAERIRTTPSTMQVKSASPDMADNPVVSLGVRQNQVSATVYQPVPYPAIGVIEEFDGLSGIVNCLSGRFTFAQADVEDANLNLNVGAEVSFTITKMPDTETGFGTAEGLKHKET